MVAHTIEVEYFKNKFKILNSIFLRTPKIYHQNSKMVSFIKHEVLLILSAIIIILVVTTRARITDSNGDHKTKALTIYRNPDLLDPGNKFCIVDFHPRRKFLKVNSYQYHTYSIILDLPKSQAYNK